MNIAAELRELARNLYWTWHPHTVDVFRDLDYALWREVNHNPVELLSRFTPQQLEKRIRISPSLNRPIGASPTSIPNTAATSLVNAKFELPLKSLMLSFKSKPHSAKPLPPINAKTRKRILMNLLKKK